MSASKRDLDKEVRLQGDGTDLPELAVSPDSTLNQRLMLTERLLRLERALDQLPEDYREVIIHAKYEGLSLDETAEAMGRSMDAVRMLLKRALSRLGTVFGGDGDD